MSHSGLWTGVGAWLCHSGSSVCSWGEGRTRYKIIMIDNSPGHLEKKRATQRNRKTELEEVLLELEQRRLSWPGCSLCECDPCLLSVALSRG